MHLLKNCKINNQVQQQLLTLETVMANQGDLVEMGIIFQKAHRRLFGN